MSRVRFLALIPLLGLLVPCTAFAATFASARTLVLSEAPADNAYLWGTDITIVAPLPADLVAFGGSATLSAPVAGDATLAAARVSVTKPVAGDLRAMGADTEVDALVGGDLMLAGANVVASSTARDTRIIGRTIRVTHTGGAATIYGADITLSGELGGDIRVISSDRVTLAPDAHITGRLSYDAPQQADMQPGAVVDGGVEYTGSSAFLPTNEEAHRLAVAGLGIFFVVRIVALIVAAGLVAGLFPLLANEIAEQALDRSARRFVALALLGFAFAVATPVLILLLAVSFVGIAVAVLLAALYTFLLISAYLFAGALAGGALARGIWKRRTVTWQDAVLGMAVLALVGSIPAIGGVVVFILALAALGALLSLGHRSAFGRLPESEIADPEIS